MPRRSRTRITAGLAGLALLAGTLVAGVGPQVAVAATVPSGFGEQIVFTGLNQPMNIEFASDGRVFVAEKAGVIKVFDNLADNTATVFADLSASVHDQWDRGLLGLALAPNFPADPTVYVLYTYDAPPGQTAPYWNDSCSTAAGGANGGNCTVTGRLSRLTANGNVMTGTEQVLIQGWCQQFPSHSLGDLKFGADGKLYVSSGDGASFSAMDHGQFGSPVNPCGDPAQEGGALRSQDVRTGADPTGLNGSVLRLEPSTGLAAAGNPNIGSADLNTRRIVAHGLRNPYRFTMRPGTNEVWLGDVGWGLWEEIDRLADPTAPVTNFGWPCYEGVGRMSSYDNANLPLCETLYSAGTATAPYYTYSHSAPVVAGENCGTGGEAIAGVAFYPAGGGSYPAAYAGAAFFADYSRNCIWAMKPTTPGGLPSTGNIQTFVQQAAAPSDLAVGPGGELYYTDLGGTVRRLRYFPANQPPTAVLGATPTSGTVPLAVAFTGASSSDADPADQGRLAYKWDFTNDGTWDSTAASPSFTYTTEGIFTAKLLVTDTLGATDEKTVSIQPGNRAPTAIIDTPITGATWKVGDTVSFTGRGTDPQQGTLPASALNWQLRMEHCETIGNCHSHVVQNWTGVAGGSFVAPDHEYPSYLELRLVATDNQGLTSTVVRRLDPRTVQLNFASSPSGLQLTVGSFTGTAPFTRQVIQGSSNTVSAPTPQLVAGSAYTYSSWSDGEAQTHVITAPATVASYTATYSGTAGSCGTDSAGYKCRLEPGAMRTASTVLPLTGDVAATQVGLPFPFPFYSQSYASAWVSTKGLISFGGAPGPAVGNNGSVPGAGAPDAAVYAFWDDLVIDGSASVRTQTYGSAPNRIFVIEWRNAWVRAVASDRVTFEMALHENGQIVFGYGAGLDSAVERGASATVGIENATGTVGLMFSYNAPWLVSGVSVLLQPKWGPPAIVRRRPVTWGTDAPVVGSPRRWR